MPFPADQHSIICCSDNRGSTTLLLTPTPPQKIPISWMKGLCTNHETYSPSMVFHLHPQKDVACAIMEEISPEASMVTLSTLHPRCKHPFGKASARASTSSFLTTPLFSSSFLYTARPSKVPLFLRTSMLHGDVHVVAQHILMYAVDILCITRDMINHLLYTIHLPLICLDNGQFCCRLRPKLVFASSKGTCIA